MSLNKVTLMGNLVRDPESKEFTGGGSVCNFCIATNYSYKNQQTGERVDKPSFIECVAKNARGKAIQQYFQKGKPIIVEGRLDQQSWEDKQTQQKRSKLVVVVETFHFLPRTKDQGASAQNAPAPAPSDPSPPSDDIPF